MRTEGDPRRTGSQPVGRVSRGRAPRAGEGTRRKGESEKKTRLIKRIFEPEDLSFIVSVTRF